MGRKFYTKEFKTQVVEEVKKCGKAIEVADKYGISPSSITRWIKERKYDKKGDNIQKLITKEYFNRNINSVVKENEQLKNIIVKKEIEIDNLKTILEKKLKTNNIIDV